MLKSWQDATRAQVWGSGLVLTMNGRRATTVPIDINIGRFTVRNLDPSVQYTMLIEVGTGITYDTFDYIMFVMLSPSHEPGKIEILPLVLNDLGAFQRLRSYQRPMGW